MDHLSDLAVFLRVAALGTFSAAADELGLSRSIVSKYVHRLERSVGARLVNRSTRSFSLTEAGRLLVAKGAQAMAVIDEARIDIARLHERPEGLIRVASPIAFGVAQLTPAVVAFRAAHPGIDVQLEMDDRLDDLVARGFDVAIRITTTPGDGQVAFRLATCGHAVFASPDRLAKMPRVDVPSDLAGHPGIIHSDMPERGGWTFRRDDGAVETIVVPTAIAANNSLAVREAAIRGGGVGFAPSYLVADDFASGALVRLLPAYRLRAFGIFAIFLHRANVTSRARVFVDFLRERFAGDAYRAWARQDADEG